MTKKLFLNIGYSLEYHHFYVDFLCLQYLQSVLAKDKLEIANTMYNVACNYLCESAFFITLQEQSE